MIKGFAIGIISTLAIGLLGAYLFIVFGLMPANADAKPSKLERWAAHKSLDATINREAPKIANPVAINDGNLFAGLKLYAANCAVCHGTADGMPSNIAKGLYQKPPQFGKHSVTDDEERETYWKINHGIRLTGMPSFHASLSETQLWQLTLFLKHMKKLPPGVQAVWEALPSESH